MRHGRTDPTARRLGTATMLSVAFRIVRAAESLLPRGAEPARALAIALRVGDIGELPADVEAMARAIWSVAIDSHGSGPDGVAPLERLLRFLDCAAMLCSLGVEPREASGVLQWLDAPDAFKAVARETWVAEVSSGAVTRVEWPVAGPSDGAGLGPATVADALSRALALADMLCSIGVDRRDVIDVLRMVAMPRRLAAAVRAAWEACAGFGDEGDAIRPARPPACTTRAA